VLPDGSEQFCAVKRILPRFAKDPELRAMFVEEARIARALKSPYIAAVHDLVDAGDALSIVMELVDGKDLHDVFVATQQRRAPLPIGVVMQILRDTLQALAAAHAAGVIHRDVCPHNIIVGFDGTSKLTDFGLAKLRDAKSQTGAGVLKGKFGYMSPEQTRAQPLDARSDLFNVGILLYEALSGERLFIGESELAILEKTRSPVVPALPTARQVPAPLDALMREALDRAPARRPADALAFDLALGTIAADHGISVTRAAVSAEMASLFSTASRR
jgi:serine/threonine protein kinase